MNVSASPLPTEAASQAARRSTLASVVVNIGLSLVQIVVGVFAHSQALIADGLHSLSDLVSDFVVLFANRYSGKAPDADHQYGHQRYENAASFVIGAILLAVGAGMLWSALQKLQTPALIPQVHLVALWVALGALAAKELLFRYMLAVAQRVRSSLLAANAWHARSDAASSLVVAIGIVGNLAGLKLLDPIAALIVGFMVGRMGWTFAWRSLHELMDHAADAGDIERIRAIAAATPGVQGVHDLRTRKMGDMILVDVHLEIDGSISVSAGHAIAVAARERIMAALPVLDVMTHVDPAGPATATMPATRR
ncbi:cation diffusion facilitator family transporter [Jeongeupia chitinilytica]|uniref:Cobalt transporter n=1 Tax=Jeongeupia chitinilytica TaxID=1041641 RepID=A0ABQ3H2W7_9NEIS|nr:cation diffusion facilitator family transporter [Jeongeupia chitinilytica]GHD67651.1 cobalt transporter [Jeongeupia chitinilytica]